MAAPEPCPLLNTSATENGTPRRRRRKSSGLGQQIYARDTRPSLGTADSSSTLSSNGLARQGSEQKKFSKSRKDRSLLCRCKYFSMNHTWTIPLVLLLAFLSLYAINPTESNIIHHFIFLSYKQPYLEAGADPSMTAHYGKGLWDIAFVSYTIVLSFTREFIMQELLHPLARFCGIKSRGKQSRFMEQMYTVIYFALMGPAGLYVMRRTPAAYSVQQAIVMFLGMEKPRKDLKEFVAHHIVTLALIALSYRFHFTYMGIAVYLTHDISDFFLAMSKSLQYVNSPATPVFFGLLIPVWIYLRHYLNLCIIFSLFTEFRTVGPYELNWETQQYKCLISNAITFCLLAALQFFNIFWLYCLLRSTYRYLVHRIVKDDRSEAQESELEEETKVEALPLLNGNGFTSGSVNGVIKASINGTGAPPTKRGCFP